MQSVQVLFGVDAQTAYGFVQSLPRTIVQRAPLEQAKGLAAALQGAGACVTLRESLDTYSLGELKIATPEAARPAAATQVVTSEKSVAQVVPAQPVPQLAPPVQRGPMLVQARTTRTAAKPARVAPRRKASAEADSKLWTWAKKNPRLALAAAVTATLFVCVGPLSYARELWAIHQQALASEDVAEQEHEDAPLDELPDVPVSSVLRAFPQMLRPLAASGMRFGVPGTYMSSVEWPSQLGSVSCMLVRHDAGQTQKRLAALLRTGRAVEIPERARAELDEQASTMRVVRGRHALKFTPLCLEI